MMTSKLAKSSILIILILASVGLACRVGSPFSTTPTVRSEAQIEENSLVGEPAGGDTAETTHSAAVSLQDQEDLLISLYKNVSPGVVSIRVLTAQGGGQGSGFVFDDEGHIVTNFHVVHGAKYIEVGFTSGFISTAEILGTDTDSDLAVLKLDNLPDDLNPLRLGDSDKLNVGQIVVAIGNPFGFNSTMTSGIISGVGRTLESLHEAPGTGGLFFSTGDIIQTDAAINPGNSGGPLLNLDGEVIGINRSIQTYNVNSEDEPINSGIGFAISVNMVKRVIPSLISQGYYEYPYLGMSSFPEITLDMMEKLGLESSNGVLVSEVTPDGPSDEAGLQPGDVIIALNGRMVRNFGELLSYLFGNTSPGDSLQITLIRDGSEMEIELIIGARP